MGQAEAVYRHILAHHPNQPDALNNLGALLVLRGDFAQAVQCLQTAIQANPNMAEAYNNLGKLLFDQENLEQSIAVLQAGLRINPNSPEMCNNLANAIKRIGRLDEATELYQRAIQLNPNYAEPWSNLGTLYLDQARHDQAIESFRQAIAINPDNVVAHGNIVYAMQFHPTADASELTQELTNWQQRCADKFTTLVQSHANSRKPNRKLKIGYVSPDFYHHAECFFVVPLLEAHDHTQFEIHCYASVLKPDDVTDRLQAAADVWHDVLALSDTELAAKIRQDEIDILIDLTMHMQRNRLLVFAQKPAPVQMTWMAYPGSTGLKTIDYRITDHFQDWPGENDSGFTEQAIHLEDGWCCYNPVSEYPPLNDSPVAQTGRITFGSLNNFCKVNQSVLMLWVRVLERVPDSRLILLSHAGSHRLRTLEFLKSLGIAPERVEFMSLRSRIEYLKLYHQIDIALDPFPYNGITTTCDAMWMGVPVVSLIGQRPAARAGFGLLSQVGLPDLTAKSEDAFEQIAVDLANNRTRLAELRSTLRRRMQRSPLMDAKRFAQNMEKAYREVWIRWCG